jgi:branched-subunit amino acid ABC-type transport system permease component
MPLRPHAWLVIVACAALLLAGCSLIDDAGEARLCRSVLPALNPDATLKILTTQRLAKGRGLKILYRAEVPDDEPRLRFLTCRFAREHGSVAQSRDLIGAETEEGRLGPERLYMLRRFWLDTTGLGTIDPSPIANAEQVPHIPATAALTLQHILAGLPQITVYGLLATAYALIYGLVGRINLAFGDFAVLGSYGALIGLVAGGGMPSIAAMLGAILLALWTAASHGAVAARLVFAPIVHQRGQVMLIASTGLALFVAEYVRLTQGSSMRWAPPVFNTPIGLARSGAFIVAVTPMTIAVALVALASGLGLVALMRRSRFGRAWRACADDPLAASLMGLNPSRVLLGTFVIASLVAGMSGAITTLFYGGVTYSGGLLLGLKALIAAILGGIGSVPGAFAGGLLLGTAEALWSAVFPIELRDPVIYALLAIVLVVRPGGIRGTPDLDPRRG